jgi:hypothetical protein
MKSHPVWNESVVARDMQPVTIWDLAWKPGLSGAIMAFLYLHRLYSSSFLQMDLKSLSPLELTYLFMMQWMVQSNPP